jgi:hypothetical protein
MTDNLNKEEFVENLCDVIVNNMDREHLERVVWDQIYDELSCQGWPDLLMMAEDYGVTIKS